MSTYQYDIDGAFIGSVFMHIPANMGLPANTTHIPCEPAHGFTGIFNGESWQYVEDNRGQQYWNEHGLGFVISSLQDSLPSWAITIEPPMAESGYVLLFSEGQWQQIRDITGQEFFESNGKKHLVPDAYFTLPKGCTFIAPLDAKPTFETLWNGSEWQYVKDLRGQVAYNTETKEPTFITEVGPLSEGYTLLVPPESKPLYATQWDGKAWGYVADLRGQVAYNTETKEPISITKIGPLSEGYTLLVPGRFDIWDGNAWVNDEEAERAFNIDQAERQKAKRLAAATEQIAVLSYAIDKGMATEEEIAKLAQWEEYRLLLNRVDTTSANIVWPEKP